MLIHVLEQCIPNVLCCYRPFYMSDNNWNVPVSCIIPHLHTLYGCAYLKAFCTHTRLAPDKTKIPHKALGQVAYQCKSHGVKHLRFTEVFVPLGFKASNETKTNDQQKKTDKLSGFPRVSFLDYECVFVLSRVYFEWWKGNSRSNDFLWDCTNMRSPLLIYQGFREAGCLCARVFVSICAYLRFCEAKIVKMQLVETDGRRDSLRHAI